MRSHIYRNVAYAYRDGYSFVVSQVMHEFDTSRQMLYVRACVLKWIRRYQNNNIYTPYLIIDFHIKKLTKNKLHSAVSFNLPLFLGLDEWIIARRYHSISSLFALDLGVYTHAQRTPSHTSIPRMANSGRTGMHKHAD